MAKHSSNSLRGLSSGGVACGSGVPSLDPSFSSNMRPSTLYPPWGNAGTLAFGLNGSSAPFPVVTKELGYHEADADPRVEALRSIYGVGLITSMTLVAEIGDISRFPTARKLCAWAGLTPSVHNSDVKVRHGHITKAGPAAVRAVLTEASYRPVTSPPFAKFFEEVAKRRGKRIATVALSRKILARCFRVLKGLETPA